MNPPSVDIKDMLEDSSSGLGLVFGTDLFVSAVPTTPNNSVTVIDTGGPRSLQYGMKRPNVQVIVRNTDYQTGYELISDIEDFLHEKCNEVWNNARYISILTRSSIGYLGKDPKARYEFSINFQIMRSEN